VAVTKVCGIETEYGIQAIGGQAMSAAGASSLLINAYVADVERKVGWDFEDESPGRDARCKAGDASLAPEIETHLVNAVLTNGARYYVDHAHPEYSTPECSNAAELVVHDSAGEAILRRSMEAANQLLGDGTEIVIYKNNSDGKGNSYGCHENYLVAREVPFDKIAVGMTAHLVSRQIYTGAGKVGEEVAHPGSEAVFQLSQRADFFEEEVGLETTLKRPIINTRDEPHADPKKYRRLHVIAGDANMSEIATFLKVGVTSFVLAMIEDDFHPGRDLHLARPVRAIGEVSRDTTLQATIELDSGERLTALELQWELYDMANKYAVERGVQAVGGDEVARSVLDRWEAVLSGLEVDPQSLADQLDWVAKLRLVEAYRSRHGLSWDDPKLAGIDLQYHDLRPAKSLFARLGMQTLSDKKDVERAMTQPPTTTRAYFRGRCLELFPSAVVAANWDSVVFDIGQDALRRVPTMEPLRGTESHVGTLLERCDTAAELLRRLGS
jgi:proteasome accessory factor A